MTLLNNSHCCNLVALVQKRAPWDCGRDDPVADHWLLNSSTRGPPNVTVIDKLKLSLISWWQFLLKEKESGASDRQTDPHWLPVFLLADCLGKDLQPRIGPVMALTVLPLLTQQACSNLHSVLFITHFCYPACLCFLLPILWVSWNCGCP